MTKNIKFVGLDVHAATVAIAVAEMGGEVRSLGVVANEVGAIRRVLGKLGKKEQLRVCYEAGPTGYALLLGAVAARYRVHRGHTFAHSQSGERPRKN